MLLNCGVGEDSWRVPWTARRSNQSILKEISPKYSLEGLMLKLKLQYFGHLMQRTDSLEKTLMLGKTEDRRRGWQRMRWLDDNTDLMNMFEQPLGVGDGQGSLACCSPRVCKESSNWSESTNKHSIQLLEELEYESAFSTMHLCNLNRAQAFLVKSWHPNWEVI